MANDPPTSMRLRFGGLEARDIGVTDFHQPRAVSSVNLARREQTALRKINRLCGDYPQLRDRFLKIAQKAARDREPNQTALHEMRKIVRAIRILERIKRGRGESSG